MRLIYRLSFMLLALFLVIAPAMTFAQTTSNGAATTTTTSGSAPAANSAPAGGTSTTTDKTTTNPDTNTSTTTSTTTTNMPWMWIVVGAVVLVGIIGVVAAGNRGNANSN